MSGSTISLSFITISILIAICGGQSNYCKICPNHTMCKSHYSGPSCSHRQYGLTQQQKNAIVKEHNRYRQLVASGNEKRGYPSGPQPKAKFMPNLVWDDELAKIAQTHANACKFVHDKCRNVERFDVGQNIVQWPTVSGQPPHKMEELIKLWYDEVALFSPKSVKNYVFDYETGHYTQMLWAKTTTIGCGYVDYFNGNDYTGSLVCNYGPSGNYGGQNVYEISR